MATKKISALTELTTPAGTEELIVNAGGTSKKITQTNLLSTALPLAGGTMTGTIAGFTSTGIDDNATSTAITIDANEQVGINTTSLLAPLSVKGGTTSASSLATAYSEAAVNITPKSTSGYSLQIGSSSGDIPYFQMSAGGAAASFMRLQPYGGGLQISTPSTISVGATTGSGYQIDSDALILHNHDAGGAARYTTQTNFTSGYTYFDSYYVNATQVGSINSNGTTTGFNTTSDYRLKEDDQPMVDSISRLKKLRPINFAWKLNGSRTDGFFAHEAGEVVPECVAGEKDGMRMEEYEITAGEAEVLDADGNVTTPAVEAIMGEREVEDYQGIDQSKLVPLLVASLQEAVAKIEALEARVTALEV